MTIDSKSIKALLRLLCLGLTGTLGACSFHSQPALLAPVGPAPTAASVVQPDGYLVVYSAWSNFVDPGSTGHHSRYLVTTEDGRLRREIINHADRFDEGPIRLPLTPGTYKVSARSAHFGRVNVPVVIQSGQTTFVYLDGASHHRSQTAQGEVVRLPNGEVVGWSTTLAGNGTP